MKLCFHFLLVLSFSLSRDDVDVDGVREGVVVGWGGQALQTSEEIQRKTRNKILTLEKNWVGWEEGQGGVGLSLVEVGLRPLATK